jgi:hypothetical protein
MVNGGKTAKIPIVEGDKKTSWKKLSPRGFDDRMGAGWGDMIIPLATGGNFSHRF